MKFLIPFILINIKLTDQETKEKVLLLRIHFCGLIQRVPDARLMEGGAGNGLFSGGGGGGNYWQGGDGGRQSSLCVNDTLVRAWGGLACGNLYKNVRRSDHGRWRWQRCSESADIKYGHQWWQRGWYYFHYYRYPGRKKR